MPRFFFHIEDGHYSPDEDGAELPSVEAARIEALRHAGDMLKDSASGGPFGKDWQMRVTNADQLILFHLNFQLTESPAIGSARQTNGTLT